MHSTDNLDDGYLGSGKRLWFSIKYHGKENHTKEILEYCETRKELKKREAEIVDEQLLTEDLCMNLVVGGEGGGFRDEEHLMKFTKNGSKAWMDKYSGSTEHLFWTTQGGKEKFKKHGIPENFKPDWVGRKHSDETKQKMSKSSKGVGKGKANSQYGTMWIHCKATGEVKKIKKEEWLSYTLLSSCIWERGRK